jgi:hypothetical protein
MNFTQANNTDFPALSLSIPKKQRKSFAPVVGKKEANLPLTCFSLPVPGQGLQINHSKTNPLLIKEGVMTDVNTGINHPLPVPKAQVSRSDEADGFVKVKKGPSGKITTGGVKGLKTTAIHTLPLDKGNSSVEIVHKYTEKPASTKAMKKNQKRRAKKAPA